MGNCFFTIKGQHTMRVLLGIFLVFMVVGRSQLMTLKPFHPFLTKRPYENNPLTKQLSKWQGPEELKHLEYGSPEWNMALFEYLLAHKGSKNMHDLLGAEELNGHTNVICKSEPYNECYSVNEKGEMKPLGPQQRPVRLLRIY